MADSFRVTVHMVSSLDGIIAEKDNNIQWFETSSNYEKGIAVSNEEIAAFLATIDCYIMGSHTYEHAVELSKAYGWPYGDVATFVVSDRSLVPNQPNVEIYSGDLNKLVDERLKPNYKNVWLVGGPILVKEFIALNLVHEIRISILPIVLGEGRPFFENITSHQLLNLRDLKAYKNGMVELTYDIRR